MGVVAVINVLVTLLELRGLLLLEANHCCFLVSEPPDVNIRCVILGDFSSCDLDNAWGCLETEDDAGVIFVLHDLLRLITILPPPFDTAPPPLALRFIGSSEMDESLPNSCALGVVSLL